MYTGGQVQFSIREEVIPLPSNKKIGFTNLNIPVATYLAGLSLVLLLKGQRGLTVLRGWLGIEKTLR
jgi:hypothetical protein